MIFITFIHLLSYTGILFVPDISKVNYIVLNIIKSFTVASVSIFIMITGFFQCTKKVNYKRLFTLWVNVIVVSTILFMVMLIIKNGDFAVTQLIKTFFPISTMHYWFLVMYVILCVSAPMLNILIEKMSITYHFWVIILGFVIINIYFVTNPFVNDEVYLGNARGIIWFYYLYVFAAYLKKYDLNIKTWLLYVLMLISFVGIFALNYLNKQTYKSANLLAGYSLLPFVFAVCCFLIFKQIKINGKVVKK